MMTRVKIATVFAGVVLLFTSAAYAASFQSAVEKVLAGQTDGPVASLDKGKQKELAACIVKVLAKVPESKKNAVAEGKDFDEMQDRFGAIVMADHAKLKQQISLQCGEIATSS